MGSWYLGILSAQWFYSYLSSLINLQSTVNQLGVSALDTGELLAGAVGIIESALFLPVGFPRLIHMTMGQGSKKIEQ